MKWKFENDRPIYLQLVDILKADIITQNYPNGQKFPSVRELAQLASVNPNTMQKALVELERQGFLETEGTNGRVVSANFTKIDNERDILIHKKIDEFSTYMKSLGCSKLEIINLIKEDEKWH